MGNDLDVSGEAGRPRLAYLGMAVDWQGQTLTDWGNDIFKSANGISATTARAGLFAP
jgi:hypothetical protein